MLTSDCGKFLRWTSILACLVCLSSQEQGHLRCPTSPDDNFQGILVNCTSKGLQASDLPLLDIPVNKTTSLILNDNSLLRIANGSFSSLHNLRRLQIDNSGIIQLERDAFEGLTELQVLSLSGNSLDIALHAFPSGVFRHTPLLEELNIGGQHNINPGNGNYPDYIDIFDYLAELTYLQIHSFKTLHIGKEFEKLVKLERLHVFSGYQPTVTNNSLEGLRYSRLKHFILSGSTPVEFGTGVFESLPHTLISLTLYDFYVGNINLLSAMEPFNGRRIPVLYLDGVSLPRNLNSKVQIDDGKIGNEDLKHLDNVCVLNMTWKNSNIMAFDLRHNSKSSFEKCIKSLDLSGNNLHDYRLQVPVKLYMMKGIEEFRLSRDGLSKHTVSFWDEKIKDVLQTISQDIKQEVGVQTDYRTVAPTKVGKRNHSSVALPYSSMHYNDHDIAEKDGDYFQHNTPEKNDKNKGINFSLTNETAAKKNPNKILNFFLPRHLHYMSLDAVPGIRHRHSQVKIGPNNLTEMYYRYATRPYVMTYPFLGFNNLRLIDYTGTSFEYIPVSFFDFFPSLQVLVLGQTQMDPGFIEIHGRRLIQNIANLVFLDLSDNGLRVLPQGMFQDNRRLRYLCLAKNRFSRIPFNIRLTPSLEKLDLRMNAFSGLAKSEQRDIDEHIGTLRGQNFTLFLEGNNLQCICSDQLLAVWILRTYALFDPNGRLSCLREDGKVVKIGESDVDQMWRKCHGQYFFLVSLLLLFAMLVLYLTVFLISVYRTYIIAKLKKMFVPEFQFKTRQDFTYDVFIGYANQECAFVRFHLLRYLEDELNLKTFVHQRDLRQDNLDWCRALADSWRTLLVITEAFLAQEMCEFIMKTAVFFESPNKPNSIVVMVTQDLLYAIPDYVTRVVKDDNIIVLPDLESRFSYEATETLRTRILY